MTPRREACNRPRQEVTECNLLSRGRQGLYRHLVEIAQLVEILIDGQTTSIDNEKGVEKGMGEWFHWWNRIEHTLSKYLVCLRVGVCNQTKYSSFARYTRVPLANHPILLQTYTLTTDRPSCLQKRNHPSYNPSSLPGILLYF